MSVSARRVRAVIVLLGVGVWSHDLNSQCPDGSPLPCGRPAVHAPAPNSVAVLYLDNLSRDTADAFLADGLTEEIIIRLGQVQRLVVKSRFEVQRFRGRAGTQDPPTLGRALNAAYLVTGSVQRGGAGYGCGWHWCGSPLERRCGAMSSTARAAICSPSSRRCHRGDNPLALARAYAALGDIDRGMEWLQRAFAERTIWLMFVRVDDELAPLRADPRYAALDKAAQVLMIAPAAQLPYLGASP